MIQQITTFKVRLIELPKIKEGEELKDLGKFTVGKKYRVYSIYAGDTFTTFLTVDDEGVFRWINSAVFRK